MLAQGYGQGLQPRLLLVGRVEGTTGGRPGAGSLAKLIDFSKPTENWQYGVLCRMLALGFR
jgi:hypothetical protein